jgi:hypothetical protein
MLKAGKGTKTTSSSSKIWQFLFATADTKPSERLRSKDAVSLRFILPILGGEGRGEGGLNVFPTGTEYTSKSATAIKNSPMKFL